MKRIIVVLVLALAAALGFSGTAAAQSGHFVQTQTCTDTGTTVECSGKVAGLGGTTFQITITAQGQATVECTNPGGNVAPGQTFSLTATGDSGPLATPRNGQYRYTLETEEPPKPGPESCPNPQWDPNIVDVSFTTATISLYEDGVLSDQVTVPVR